MVAGTPKIEKAEVDLLNDKLTVTCLSLNGLTPCMPYHLLIPLHTCTLEDSDCTHLAVPAETEGTK